LAFFVRCHYINLYNPQTDTNYLLTKLREHSNQYSSYHEMARTLPTFVLALVAVVGLTVLVDAVAPAHEFYCIGEPNLESCEICCLGYNLKGVMEDEIGFNGSDRIRCYCKPHEFD